MEIRATVLSIHTMSSDCRKEQLISTARCSTPHPAWRYPIPSPSPCPSQNLQFFWCLLWFVQELLLVLSQIARALLHTSLLLCSPVLLQIVNCWKCFIALLTLLVYSEHLSICLPASLPPIPFCEKAIEIQLGDRSPTNKFSVSRCPHPIRTRCQHP